MLWLALKPTQARHIVVSFVMTGEIWLILISSAGSRGVSFGPQNVPSPPNSFFHSPTLFVQPISRVPTTITRYRYITAYSQCPDLHSLPTPCEEVAQIDSTKFVAVHSFVRTELPLQVGDCSLTTAATPVLCVTQEQPTTSPPNTLDTMAPMIPAGK